ncbi:hypothetical protein FBU30_007787 [Linnemannia zychae]|nr:hypothetical protein FBU30_007787 [Linnemannia zychae]
MNGPYEIPDYNKMYNTSSYPSIQTMQPMQPPDSNNQLNDEFNPSSSAQPNNDNYSNKYGPLDRGEAPTPTFDNNNTNTTVNMAPFKAPPSNNNDHQQARGRRSSISDFIVGIDSSNQIPLRKTKSHVTPDSSDRRRSSFAKFFKTKSQSDRRSSSLGRRRSSFYSTLGFEPETEGQEHKGPYADVSRSQAEFMDHLRETERNLNITHNADGLPIPNEELEDPGVAKRRSSLANVARFFGWGKPLLAR